jgi:hypothetical protein
MKNFFKRLMLRQQGKKEFVFTTRNLGESTGNGTRIADGVGNQLGNFISIETLADNSLTAYTSSLGGVLAVGPQESSKTPSKPADERKAVEPKAVFEEIKRDDPGISFEDLDEKIAAVEERIRILSEHLPVDHLGDENRTLFFLKNRKKYLKTRKKNPIDWAMTNREAIKDLCSRYKLRSVPLKQYYTLVPSQGLEEMSRYTKAYKAVTGDEPIFELIIKEAQALPPDEAKEVRKKDRDPILVANSPFSNSMFVLGAWDDEVEVVDEIIYGQK